MLSHPFVVEAAETLCVPVAVRNNTQGDADAAVRERLREAAWNNPVVRWLGADEKDLAPKLHDDWSVAAMLAGTAAALRAAKAPVPGWLDLAAKESGALRRGLERAVFSQA